MPCQLFPQVNIATSNEMPVNMSFSKHTAIVRPLFSCGEGCVCVEHYPPAYPPPPHSARTVQVERASKVMEYLITGFASPNLFSRELIEYFTAETKTSISRVEKFKYEFRFPKDVPSKCVCNATIFVQGTLLGPFQ